MGVSGTLEFLSDLVGSGGQKHKKRQLQTVELKVRMDCDGCELKVKNALSSMTVAQPFATQAYDKRAPPGYVRKVENTANISTVTRYEDPYTSMFSDDNPNACSVM